MSSSGHWKVPIFKSLTTPGARSSSTLNEEQASILLHAEKKGLELIKQGKLESEKIREEARTEGYETGYQSGLESGQETIAETREILRLEHQETLYELHQKYQEKEQLYLEEIADKLEELAIAACLRMVDSLDRHKLPSEEIRKLIVHLNPSSVLKVRVHPEAKNSWPVHLPIELLLDETLQPGDFYLETDSGLADGSWDKRLSKLIENIRTTTKHSQESEEND